VFVFRPLFALAIALGLALAPSPALAELPDGVKIERKIKSKKVEQTFLGTWAVSLPDEAKRSLEIARAALTGEPIESLGHLDLTEDEQAAFAMFQLLMLSEDGEESRSDMLKEIEAAADGMTFIVAADTIGISLGDEVTEASWSTLRTKNNLLVISASMQGEQPNEINVHFLSRDRAVLTGQGNDPIYLNRAD